MPATEAQIRANQANAARSTGPKTDEGKGRSRQNACKHGLTGAGVVMPEDDAAEVERLAGAFRDELKPSGPAGEALVRQIAVFSVRMDRGFRQETAALAKRVRRAMEEFEAPEGVDAETAERLRVEAGKIAQFDDSKEAALARRYEAASTRGFFRALKELRQLGKASAAPSAASEVASQVEASIKQLGSFFPASTRPAASVPTPPPAPSKPPLKPVAAPSADWDPFATDHFDVPIAIGKRR